jgi:hypothetical protein
MWMPLPTRLISLSGARIDRQKQTSGPGAFQAIDQVHDAAISQGALNVDEKIKELIEIGSFDYELFKFTPHGDEILVTEIPQCSRATPEGNPADIDQAAEAASERKPDVEINDAEDFAAGVRDPESEGGATNEDAGEIRF